MNNPILRLVKPTQEGVVHKLHALLLMASKKIEGAGLDITVHKISVTPTDNPEHGDYASNLALIFAKKLGKNPRDLAEELVTNIKEDTIQKVETAGPGFINFTLSPDYLIEQVKRITKEKDNFSKIFI